MNTRVFSHCGLPHDGQLIIDGDQFVFVDRRLDVSAVHGLNKVDFTQCAIEQLKQHCKFMTGYAHEETVLDEIIDLEFQEFAKHFQSRSGYDRLPKTHRMRTRKLMPLKKAQSTPDKCVHRRSNALFTHFDEAAQTAELAQTSVCRRASDSSNNKSADISERASEWQDEDWQRLLRRYAEILKLFQLNNCDDCNDCETFPGDKRTIVAYQPALNGMHIEVIIVHSFAAHSQRYLEYFKYDLVM